VTCTFGDLYDWAGEPRTVDIAKHKPFCQLRHLTAYAAEVFGRLRAADHLRGLDRGDFGRAASGLYGDINAPHPFREANGRTQRSFVGASSALPRRQPAPGAHAGPADQPRALVTASVISRRHLPGAEEALPDGLHQGSGDPGAVRC
jgi:hypothetical protein